MDSDARLILVEFDRLEPPNLTTSRRPLRTFLCPGCGGECLPGDAEEIAEEFSTGESFWLSVRPVENGLDTGVMPVKMTTHLVHSHRGMSVRAKQLFRVIRVVGSP
jgi:hypothetical protein